MRKVPRSVLTGIVDAVVIIIGLVVAWQMPESEEFVMGIVLALQPVVLSLLLFFFGEEVAAQIAAKLR